MTAIHAAIRIPRVRWGIGVLLGAGGLINYFDRINLSVGAPQLQQEFGLTDGELGWLFSGFFWSYAVLQIPSGMILDRFGVTAVYRVSSFLWSLTSATTALAGGFGGVLAARLLLGIAEGPGFPASGQANGYWCPRGERAMATSIFDAAAKFANVIGVPLVALVAGLGVRGWLIDHLIARGYDETPVRKTVLVVGMLLGLAVFGATATSDPVWAIIWISVALSGLAAAAPVGWSIPSLIAPRGGTGTIGGIMNFLNNMMGVVAPVTTGYIVGATGSFVGAFLTAGIVLAVGIIAYVSILGRLG